MPQGIIPQGIFSHINDIALRFKSTEHSRFDRLKVLDFYETDLRKLSFLPNNRLLANAIVVGIAQVPAVLVNTAGTCAIHGAPGMGNISAHLLPWTDGQAQKSGASTKHSPHEKII